MNHLLVRADQDRVGREASPSAAVIDSQSVKTSESGGPRGYDAGSANHPPQTLAALPPLDPATRAATVTSAATAYPNLNHTTAPPTRATAGAKIAAATGATARTIIATPGAVPISLSLSFDPHASGPDRNALSGAG